MPAQTGKACWSTSISLQHRTGGDEGMERVEESGGQREGMGNKFVFFLFHFQLAIVCIYQSQVLLLR